MEFTTLSNNRIYVGKLQPPVIPFMPLLLKDMTFAHEGNKTSVDGLVNFEKMHMMASTMRAVRFCRSRHLGQYNFQFMSSFHQFTFILLQFWIHRARKIMKHKFDHISAASVLSIVRKHWMLCQKKLKFVKIFHLYLKTSLYNQNQDKSNFMTITTPQA